MRIAQIELPRRVRTDGNEGASGGLQVLKRSGPVEDVERWYDGIVRRLRVAQEVEPELSAGERNAVRRSLDDRAPENVSIEVLGGRRIRHVQRKLVVGGESHGCGSGSGV
jgi:hypothetical protein